MALRSAISLVTLVAQTFLLGGCVVLAVQDIVKNPDSSAGLCNLRFPAIREDTLFTDHPVLKDPGDGDIIHFYGPCDHDPLGREEILRQRADYRREDHRRRTSD
jgi:hypothetical protein